MRKCEAAVSRRAEKATRMVRTEGLVPCHYESNNADGDAAMLISSSPDRGGGDPGAASGAASEQQGFFPINIGRRGRGPGKNWRRRPLGSTCDAVQSGE